jgi:hypothetical protein
MRVLISLGVFVLVFVVGVKTEWVSVSQAAPTTSDRVAQEDRAYEAVVLGQTRPDATSGELIDAAVTRGEISSEQGLLYGVYLACGDPRLPAQFRGQDTTPPEKNILWEADVDWTSLSPDIRQALHAFFTEGPAAQVGLTCADEIARLKRDPSVWWAQAVQGEQAPVRLASNP